MSTIVWLHAHPDDESILTGGTMLRAAAEGHRNVLVVATNGDHGEVPADLLPGETIVERRRAELEASAAELDVQRIVWLGYHDSGLTGWVQNDHPAAFVRADLDEAAQRVAAIVQEEQAAALVTYDWHGNYGHPDHVKVHQVGHRAAARIGETVSPRLRLFEVTVNRDHLEALAARLGGLAAQTEAAEEPVELGALDVGSLDFGATDDGNPIGMPAAALTHEVDVSAWTARKRSALACHASQVTDVGFFLRIPEPVFATAFGTEWFIEVGRSPGSAPRWLLD